MRELLFSITKKDFSIDWFSGTGAGGQHRNKCQNACRIKHIESGVVATAQDQRSQKANLKNAFKRLTEKPKFKIWLNKKIHEHDVDMKALNNKVNRMMSEENLKVEYLD